MLRTCHVFAPSNVTVETEQDLGIPNSPAAISVYQNNVLVMELIATIELKQGTDGGNYNCIVLTRPDRSLEKPPTE